MTQAPITSENFRQSRSARLDCVGVGASFRKVSLLPDAPVARRAPWALAVLLLFAVGGTTCKPLTGFRAVEGFKDETNQRLRDFFARHERTPGRKVAVFDGDGTTFGQVPHYLADECLFEHAARNPNKKPAVIARMRRLSNVSMEYVQLRVNFFEGDTLEDVRNLGMDCYKRMYAGKIYRPMQDLIKQLQRHGFEVWVVTASPEALYQKFLSEGLGIPITNVVGVKSVIRSGKITKQMVQPVPQDHGKLEAIETFIQARPLLSGGNSRGDKEMIEYSADLKLIINPDQHVGHDQTISIAEYAKKQGWLVEKIKDVAAPDFPAISSKTFGMRQNTAHP